MDFRISDEHSRLQQRCRALAADFAKSHPAMAERLGVSENADESKDPHVERLIDASADDQFNQS